MTKFQLGLAAAAAAVLAFGVALSGQTTAPPAPSAIVSIPESCDSTVRMTLEAQSRFLELQHDTPLGRQAEAELSGQPCYRYAFEQD